MSVPLLFADNIAKSYGSVSALKSASLTVAAGEAHALLGANGAGKSTFVKILTGIISADSGSIAIDGTAIRSASPRVSAAKGIAPVFQDPALIGDLTVRQNMRLTGTSPRRVADELNNLDIAGLDLDEMVRDIPLPFLRMIDLARALSHSPRLLVLDEITAALPPDLSERVFDVIRRQTSGSGSVLFISHRLEEVVTHCDMCTVFRDGRDVERFDPEEGGEARIVHAMLGDVANLVRDEARRPRAELLATTPRLEAKELAYGRRLTDVSIKVYPGEVLGIAALEGQGQETLFDLLAGEHRPDSGEILVDGDPMKARHPADAIRKGVVLVPADRVLALLPQRSIHENIALSLRARVSTWGPINMARERRTVNDSITRLSIDTRASSQAGQLSGGNQQKLGIARWLAAGFHTLLLFDPTRGIDIGTKHQIYDLVRSLADDGAAVVMFTSELREIELVCDRVTVLYDGKVVAELPPDVGEEALLSAAHGLAHLETKLEA